MNDPGDTPTPTHGDRAVGMWYFLLLAIANLIWAAQGTAVKFLERPGPEGSPHLGPIGITFLPFYVTTLLVRAAVDLAADGGARARTADVRAIGGVRHRRHLAARCWRSWA